MAVLGSVSEVQETIRVTGPASTGEEAVGKKSVLGVEPINCIYSALNWHLKAYDSRGKRTWV